MVTITYLPIPSLYPHSDRYITSGTLNLFPVKSSPVSDSYKSICLNFYDARRRPRQRLRAAIMCLCPACFSPNGRFFSPIITRETDPGTAQKILDIIYND